MAIAKTLSMSYTKVSDEFSSDDHNTALQRPRRPAWFVGVSTGLGLAIATLTVNVSILAWIQSSFDVSSEGIAIIYEGTCSKTNSLMVASHLLINIISTLLLAASNFCAQLLISPTRRNVDQAHARGQWLHIGFVSLRNLRWVSWWRICSWSLLMLSSLPLHLV